MSSALVELRAISKSYPGARALEGVDFDVRAGEVHALAGQNGAGKSTLVRILGGVERPDAGSIVVEGREVHLRTPLDALRAGIAVLHQETQLVPQLSVAENFFLGRELRRGIGLDWRAMRARARERLRELGVELDVDRRAGDLPAALAQVVAVARAIDLDARVLVLDEPTSSLDRGEVARLFELMRRLRARGIGLVFIAHSLEQIYAVADRISVLRDGRHVGTDAARELPSARLVALMLGREERESSAATARPLEDAPIVLEARGLARQGSIEPFDLKLRRGEIVGLAGLLGSGRSALARLLAGVEAPTAGALQLDGRAARLSSPRAALGRGIAFTPEDRKLEGIFPTLSLRENVAITAQRGISRLGWVSIREHRRLAQTYVASLRIVAADIDQPIGTLSGGNQQKALLARSLAANPRILVLDEPTRGVDVGSRAEIEAAIEALAARGIAIVFVSTAIEALVRCAQRVLVLRDFRVVAELAGSQATEARVMEVLGAGDERG